MSLEMSLKILKTVHQVKEQGPEIRSLLSSGEI